MLYPLSQSLLLCLLALLALFFHRIRLAALALLLGLGWLYLCSTSVFADYLMGTLEDGYPPKALSVVEPADAIVLLGGAIRGDVHLGTLGDLNQQADRLVHAVSLYKAGKSPLLVVTGGGPSGARPEAQIMYELLQVMGIPAAAIVQEGKSRDTYQNAVYTAQILKERGIRRILLVTSAFHMRRAQALFVAQGLEVVPAPTDYQRLASPPLMSPWLPSVGDLWQSTYALHELLGYQIYRYQGRL